MKKFISFIVVFVLLFSFSAISISACDDASQSSQSCIEINLNEMEVGDVIYVGTLAFEKAPEGTTPEATTRSTTEGFTVSSFGGNTSLNKVLALNSTYRYFRIFVNNTGSGKIKVDIGGKYTTSVSPGSLYIYSTEAWSATSHTVSFSCDSGMYGNAQAMLCSTLAEATPS